MLASGRMRMPFCDEVRLVEGHEAAVGRQPHRRAQRVPRVEGEAHRPESGRPGRRPSGKEGGRAEAEREQPRCHPQEPLPGRGSRHRRGRRFLEPLGEQEDPRLADVAQAQLRVALEAALEQAAHARGASRPAAPPTAARASGPRPARRATVSPSKSLRPVSISKSTTPKDQMSARWSTGLPLACSGDM